MNIEGLGWLAVIGFGFGLFLALHFLISAGSHFLAMQAEYKGRYRNTAANLQPLSTILFPQFYTAVGKAHHKAFLRNMGFFACTVSLLGVVTFLIGH